jgi:hypothetical protein
VEAASHECSACIHGDCFIHHTVRATLSLHVRIPASTAPQLGATVSADFGYVYADHGQSDVFVVYSNGASVQPVFIG